MKNRGTITENVVVVEGVALSGKAIERLHYLQDTDNNGLKSLRDDIADAVCFLSEKLMEPDHSDEDSEKMKELSSSLSFIRKVLDDLKKP